MLHFLPPPQFLPLVPPVISVLSLSLFSSGNLVFIYFILLVFFSSFTGKFSCRCFVLGGRRGGRRKGGGGNEIISSPEEFSLFQCSGQRDPQLSFVSLLTLLFNFSSPFLWLSLFGSPSRALGGNWPTDSIQKRQTFCLDFIWTWELRFDARWINSQVDLKADSGADFDLLLSFYYLTSDKLK